MVNTRIFEQIFSEAGRSQDASVRGSGAGGGRRMLAVSGSRALRVLPGDISDARLRRGEHIDASWAALNEARRAPSLDRLQRRISSVARNPTLVARFDQLRTQLLQAFQKRELCSIGICAPSPGAGASFVSGGLLASLARLAEPRIVGLDLNLASPGLHDVFALETHSAMAQFLTGEVALESHLVKLTDSVALGLNDSHDPLEGQLVLHSAEFPRRMDEIRQALAPDMIVCDLPPLLTGDSALATLPHLDAVLIVADATTSTAAELAECERLVQDRSQFLGILLNRGDERGRMRLARD